MPDGSKRNFSDENAILKDLLTLTKAATQRVEQLLQRAKVHCQSVICDDGRVDPVRLETHQLQAHGLAWLATYTESLRQMHNWAASLAAEDQFSLPNQLILQIGFAEYLQQIIGGIPMSQSEILRPQDIGLTPEDVGDFQQSAVVQLMQSGNSQAAKTLLVTLMQEDQGNLIFGNSGLDEELEMIREQFRRYTLERIEPHAHDWHLQVIDPYGVASGASGGIVGALAPHVPENWSSKKAFQFESLMMADGFWTSVQAASGLSVGYARLGRVQPLPADAALDLALARGENTRQLWQGQAGWQAAARAPIALRARYGAIFKRQGLRWLDCPALAANGI